MSLSKRFQTLKWALLKRSGLTNLRVNRLLRRARDEHIAATGIAHDSIDITESEYMAAIQCPELLSFQRFAFAHRKVLEYLTSVRLAGLIPVDGRICDFAGGLDPFIKWAANKLVPKGEACAIDPILTAKDTGRIRYVRGDTRRIDLPDSSVDLISCHHSIEHFRGDDDSHVMHEFQRVLKSGGVAVVVPIFLTTVYAEIWNESPDVASYDPRACRIIDRTSPFPGWGPFEHFARVYDFKAFQQRLVDKLEPFGSVTLVEVTYAGRTCPDIELNAGLPQLCERMLALRFEKAKTF